MRHPKGCDCDTCDKERLMGFELINLITDESHGVFETLDEARGAVRFDKLKAYSIWHLNTRVECCEPYTGSDDRIKQMLGLPNASEAWQY